MKIDTEGNKKGNGGDKNQSKLYLHIKCHNEIHYFA